PVDELADELVVLRVLGDALTRDQARVRRTGRDRQREVEVLSADQVAELDGLAAAGDGAVARRKRGRRDPELRGGHVEQLLVRVRSSGPGLGRAARDAAAAAAAARRVEPRLGMGVLHHAHVRDVELLCDEHQDARRRARELRLAVRDDHLVVLRDRKPGVARVQVGKPVTGAARVERRVARRSKRIPGPVHAEADDECAAGLEELLPRELLLVQKTRHRYFPPFAITAAACLIAVRILGYVPQRQRWPFIAVRIWSSVGFFVVESRSAAWIIIPFWQ